MSPYREPAEVPNESAPKVVRKPWSEKTKQRVRGFGAVGAFWLSMCLALVSAGQPEAAIGISVGAIMVGVLVYGIVQLIESGSAD